VEILWRSCGDSVEILWRFSRDCSKILWRFCGDSVEILWRLFQDSLEIIEDTCTYLEIGQDFQRFLKIPEDSWRFCGDSVEMISRLFGNYWRYLHIFGDWSRFSEIPEDSWRFCGDSSVILEDVPWSSASFSCPWIEFLKNFFEYVEEFQWNFRIFHRFSGNWVDFGSFYGLLHTFPKENLKYQVLKKDFQEIFEDFIQHFDGNSQGFRQ